MSQSENKVHIFAFVEIGGFLEREDIEMNEKEGEVQGEALPDRWAKCFQYFLYVKL